MINLTTFLMGTVADHYGYLCVKTNNKDSILFNIEIYLIEQEV